jgi:membrane carboxypeptidase/penicillin-binding protein PbpC
LSARPCIKRLLRPDRDPCYAQQAAISIAQGLAVVARRRAGRTPHRRPTFPAAPAGRSAPQAQLVVAVTEHPLRAFPDREHIWRHPIGIEDVSPRYIEALVAYEDRSFWWHPGVNPWALLRAGWQWLRHGEVVSGGSTLSMQVARLLEPDSPSRSVAGKLRADHTRAAARTAPLEKTDSRNLPELCADGRRR